VKRCGGGKAVRLTVWVLSLFVTTATADISPWRMGGNLEYNYRQSATQPGNASSYDNRLLGGLDIGGYFWQPWIATADAGATASLGKTHTSGGTHSEADLLTGRFNFNLFPGGFLPIAYTYQSSDNVVDWANTQNSFLQLGERYRSRYQSARIGMVFPQGDRIEGYWQNNNRGADKADMGRNIDDVWGLKAQLRADGLNFYATGTEQLGTQSITGDRQTSRNLVANIGLYPGSDFYLNTLVTFVGVERTDGKNRPAGTIAPSNGSFASNSDTATRQMASYFYWRPEYKPYALTGGARLHQRSMSTSFAITEIIKDTQDPSVPQWAKFINADLVNEQYDIAANMAADYQFTPRTRFYVTTDLSNANSSTSCEYTNSKLLSNEALVGVRGCSETFNNSWGSTGTGALIHQSDKYVYNGIGWYWYTDASATLRLLAQYQARDLQEGVGAGLTHTGYYNRTTGNRGNVRMSATQGVRQQFAFSSPEHDRLNLAHTISVSWNNTEDELNSFVQAVVSDNRELGFDRNTQLVNFQYSNTLALTRVSSFGGHVSAQSSRRYEPTLGSTGFLTTASARISYNHSRMFGVFRLRFGTRSDISWVESQFGGMHRQIDWQNDLDYNIGRLSTALIYRVLYNEAAQTTQLVLFKLSRNF